MVGRHEDREGGKHEQADRPGAPAQVAELGVDQRGGSRQLLFLVRLSPHRGHHVRQEEGQENGGVQQADLPAEGDQEGVERGPDQKTDLEVLPWIELQPGGAGAITGDEHDRGPAHPDQQSVGSRHVRHRVGGVGRVLARGPGEVQVDRVLGQNPDERQHQQRERLRDVALSELARPGQHERRTEDGQARQQRDGHGLHPHSTKGLGDHPRNREHDSGAEPEEVAQP